ncbi:hypothetical protein FO519_005828 [Halicephalobus sp. NKZ332]|nr:hypothetical protein FO519_005828 [Halicephalobus sp. NKZ332]
MEDSTFHALHCQPSTSGQAVQRDSESPISPSGSNGSKNTTTNSSSTSPQPQQIFPLRSPSLETSSSGVRKLFGKASAPLSARAQLIPSLNSQVPPQQRLLQVHSLTKDTLTVAVEQKCQVWDVYHCCCTHLGVNDPRFLGLALRAPSEGIGTDRPRHEYFFLQNDQKVSKYLPKQSRFSRTSSADKCRPVLVLYLRVKVFVERIDMITCPVVLHHYYLQLRENLLDQWSGANSVREERCWELATLALQADEGSDQSTPNQFRVEKYFPLWVINNRGLDYVRKNMPKVCRSGDKLSPKDAKMQFCQEASRSPFALNSHLYGLRRHKADLVDNALLGITDKGIDMWDVGTEGERILLRALPWNKMSLIFDYKKLTIEDQEKNKMSLYAQSTDKARYLLNFCKDVHQQLIQINLHFATSLNKYTYNSFPPGWGYEVNVDNGRPPSPASNNGPRGASPHPLMRIHQQQSMDETEAPESEVSSTKERTNSEASSVPPHSLQEPQKKKRSSGGARAKISNSSMNVPPPINTKPGRYEPHNSRMNRVSPTYSNEFNGTVTPPGDNSAPPSATPAELETFLNNAASPPRYQISDEELQYNSAMTNSTSSGMSLTQVPQGPQTGNVQSAIQRFEANGFDPTMERRARFVYSKTFDDQAIQHPIQMIEMEPASRSMHDLRFNQTSNVNIPAVNQMSRLPPNYETALHQHIMQHRQYVMTQNPMLPNSVPQNLQNAVPQNLQNSVPQNLQNIISQQKPNRWQTVTGVDPDLVRLLEQMKFQNQQLIPGPQTPGSRAPMNHTQIEQQQEQFGVHRGVSEPRLNQNYYANIPQQPPPQRNPVQQKPMGSPVTNGKKTKRYTSQSPSSRGINRVKSMPNPGIFVNDLNPRYPNEETQNQNPSRPVHFQKQPPPYDQALQMQREVNRKCALEKRHSTSGIPFDQVKNYPMIQMLVEENGGMPSASASDDTSTTSLTMSQAPHLQNREYDRSSLESHTPPLEDFLQREASGSFSDRYTPTPSRYNLVQQTQNLSNSPPSPPFHYNNGPIVWNGSGGFVRGEYFFQDRAGLAHLLNHPQGYFGFQTNGTEIRPNGIFRPAQEVADLPTPPAYPQGSLVIEALNHKTIPRIPITQDPDPGSLVIQDPYLAFLAI